MFTLHVELSPSIPEITHIILSLRFANFPIKTSGLSPKISGNCNKEGEANLKGEIVDVKTIGEKLTVKFVTKGEAMNLKNWEETSETSFLLFAQNSWPTTMNKNNAITLSHFSNSLGNKPVRDWANRKWEIICRS